MGFDLRKLDGTKVHASARWDNLKLLAHSGTMLSEYRNVKSEERHAVSSPA